MFEPAFLDTLPAGARLGSWLVVASSGRRTIGYVWIVGAIGERNGAYIEEVAVLPDSQREGVGTQLMLAACSWLADGSYTWVGVTSLPDGETDRRQAWFRRLGFAPEGGGLFSADPKALGS